MQGASHIRAIVAIAAVLAFAGLTSTAAAVPRGFDTGRASTAAKSTASPWSWTIESRQWAAQERLLPIGLLRRGPRARITRGQFLMALIRLQRERGDEAQLMLDERPAPALVDAPENSAPARAVAYSWFFARGGKFEPSRAITADEAALAISGALGMRPAVGQFAMRMRSELPGVRARWLWASAHALTRTIGLRYNVKDPHDELELGPRDALNVAHGTYMLHAASEVDGWRMGGVERLATEFDLPELGGNQKRVLGTGVRLLGHPYVWAGETEGRQAEGKGGFDCSGFTIRIVNGSGVPRAQLARVNERTTYTQSAIPSRSRLAVDDLQPADLVFFGDKAGRSRPSQNFHVGVYMGNGWFIHSSGGNGGVAIDSLDGWWGEHFSWGRRALRAP